MQTPDNDKLLRQKKEEIEAQIIALAKELAQIDTQLKHSQCDTSVSILSVFTEAANRHAEENPITPAEPSMMELLIPNHEEPNP